MMKTGRMIIKSLSLKPGLRIMPVLSKKRSRMFMQKIPVTMKVQLP